MSLNMAISFRVSLGIPSTNSLLPNPPTSPSTSTHSSTRRMARLLGLTTTTSLQKSTLNLDEYRLVVPLLQNSVTAPIRILLERPSTIMPSDHHFLPLQGHLRVWHCP